MLYISLAAFCKYFDEGLCNGVWMRIAAHQERGVGQASVGFVVRHLPEREYDPLRVMRIYVRIYGGEQLQTHPSIVITSAEETGPIGVWIIRRLAYERLVCGGGELVGPGRQHEVVQILECILDPCQCVFNTVRYVAYSVCPQRPAIVLAVPSVEIFRLEAFSDALERTL